MKNKDLRVKNRPRPRMKVERKMLILIGSSILCLLIAFIIVFNLSSSQEAKAINGATSKQIIMLPEDQLSTSFTMPAQATRSMPVSRDAQLGHVAKPLQPVK